ncbi:MAG TPA: acylphosphatase [Chitinophagaceae bacterium]|nr:acylphosphatase [Chitinophagaceae bacterium]
MPTIHLLITGKVQGIFYRATAKKIANQLNIKGWIKNTKDGNVEATATGNEEQLKEFINWCKQGPENAKVEEVIIEQKPITSFDTFDITR